MPINVFAAAPGVLFPRSPSATVLNFNDLSVGSLPSYRFNGGTLSGSGAVEDTTVVDKFARPAGDKTDFLTVSYPSASDEVTLSFANPQNYFGLYWGSLDIYNSVTFLQNNDLVVTYSGDSIASITGLIAKGNQQSASSNRYLEFEFDSGFYNEVTLNTTDYGLEVDNIAFGDLPFPITGDPTSSIPEPNSLLVLGSSLTCLALLRRRREYRCSNTHLVTG